MNGGVLGRWYHSHVRRGLMTAVEDDVYFSFILHYRLSLLPCMYAALSFNIPGVFSRS